MNLSIRPQPWYVKVTCALLSIITIGYLAILGKELLSPLFFAGLLGILLLPLAAFFERKCRLPRAAAAIITSVLFLSAVALLFYVLGGQGHTLAREWPQFKLQLDAAVKQLQNWVAATAHIDMDQQLMYFNHASTNLFSSGPSMIVPALLSLSAMVFFVLFTFIYTIFFLRYRSHIMQFFVSVFGAENTVLVQEIAGKIQTIIRQFIIGLLIEMGAISATLCIAFSLIGVHYAILLGLLGGLLNLIPYVGIFITLIISTLITFATAGSAAKVLLVILVLVSTHLIDSNLLFPWIVGSKVRINPMAMIAGVIVGGMIWGIAGMFLSIPAIAVLKIIFDRIDNLKPWGLLLGSGDKPKVRSYPKAASPSS